MCCAPLSCHHWLARKTLFLVLVRERMSLVVLNPCSFANLVNMVFHTAADSMTLGCRSRAPIISLHMLFTSGPIHQKSGSCRNTSISLVGPTSCNVISTCGGCARLSSSNCLTLPRIHCWHMSTNSATIRSYHCWLVQRLQGAPKQAAAQMGTLPYAPSHQAVGNQPMGQSSLSSRAPYEQLAYALW